MSADDFYLVRVHPKGGFAVVMGNGSTDYDDDYTNLPAETRDTQYATLREAVDYASEQYAEYGWSTHPECEPFMHQCPTCKRRSFDPVPAASTGIEE